jgi:hypothetical protein
VFKSLGLDFEFEEGPWGQKWHKAIGAATIVEGTGGEDSSDEDPGRNGRALAFPGRIGEKLVNGNFKGGQIGLGVGGALKTEGSDGGQGASLQRPKSNGAIKGKKGTLGLIEFFQKYRPQIAED